MLERWTKVSLAAGVRPAKIITRPIEQNAFQESPPATV
jgi:hypothetical protein